MIRTRQPQGAVRVDWANPITKGLRRAIIPTSGWYGTDVVGNASYSAFYGGSTPAKIAPDSIGLCFLQHRALYNQCLQVATWTNVTSEASLLIIRRGAGTILCQASTAKDEFPFSGLAYCQSFWTSRWMSGVAAPSGNSFSGANTIIHSVKNGSQKSFWNGIGWHSSTATGGFSLPATVSFGCDASGETNGQCNIALALLFDSALSSAEAASLSLNPWQIFAPSRRLVVFGAGTGGGAVTGTATITPAPHTLTGVGAVAVAGTLNKTPAAQTATTAVAVAIAGTLNKTPAAQTVTTAGTVAVSGTFNKAPAAQTLTASGTVASGVTGTANITPAAQTVTAAGTVAIAASATITPSAQTATASGAVQVAATATVTPAAQTVTATGTVVSGVVGNASITPAAQTATASGTVAIAATATVTPAAQTVSATAAVSGGAVTGTANIYVSAQTLVAAANIIVLGTANITPAAQTLLGLEAGTLPAEIPESSRTLSQMAGRLGSEWVDTDPARLGLATARRSRPRLG
jgi:hypothetical protein